MVLVTLLEFETYDKASHTKGSMITVNPHHIIAMRPDFAQGYTQIISYHATNVIVVGEYGDLTLAWARAL